MIVEMLLTSLFTRLKGGLFFFPLSMRVGAINSCVGYVKISRALCNKRMEV